MALIDTGASVTMTGRPLYGKIQKLVPQDAINASSRPRLQLKAMQCLLWVLSR